MHVRPNIGPANSQSLPKHIAQFGAEAIHIPEKAVLVLDAAGINPDELTDRVVAHLSTRGYFEPPDEAS